MTRARRRRTNRSTDHDRTRSPAATTTGPDVPVTGTLEVLPDGYGFLRQPAAGFASEVDDAYVPRSLINRYGLLTGCEIRGGSQGHHDDRPGFRLQEIATVNNLPPDAFRRRPSFDRLTPHQPRQRLCLETPDEMSLRIVELVAPIGKGQRGLIVSPPRAGKTVLLQQLAQAILENHPECHVIILLIDERPEEVTEIQEMVAGRPCEVISSTFDQMPSNHVRLAKLVLGRAKRFVECGRLEEPIRIQISYSPSHSSHNAKGITS